MAIGVQLILPLWEQGRFMWQLTQQNSPFPSTIMAIDALCLAVLWFDIKLMTLYMVSRVRCSWPPQTTIPNLFNPSIICPGAPRGLPLEVEVVLRRSGPRTNDRPFRFDHQAQVRTQTTETNVAILRLFLAF